MTTTSWGRLWKASGGSDWGAAFLAATRLFLRSASLFFLDIVESIEGGWWWRVRSVRVVVREVVSLVVGVVAFSLGRYNEFLTTKKAQAKFVDAFGSLIRGACARRCARRGFWRPLAPGHRPDGHIP